MIIRQPSGKASKGKLLLLINWQQRSSDKYIHRIISQMAWIINCTCLMYNSNINIVKVLLKNRMTDCCFLRLTLVFIWSRPLPDLQASCLLLMANISLVQKYYIRKHFSDDKSSCRYVHFFSKGKILLCN